MKGQQFAVLSLFWLLCLGIIWFGTQSGVRYFGGGDVHELPVKVHVYAMDNALDASRVYMDTGLTYSVYQACYDSLANGGWSGGSGGSDGSAGSDMPGVPADKKITVGGVDYPLLALDDDFVAGLNGEILSNLNIYSSMGYTFFEDYEVQLPVYDNLEFVDVADSFIMASASSSSDIYICEPSSCELEDGTGDGSGDSDGEGIGSGSMDTIDLKRPNVIEKVVIRKSANVFENVETPCYGMYKQGVAEASRLATAIEAELSKEVGRLLGGVVVTGGQGSCASMLSDAETIIRHMLESSTTATVEVLEVTLNVLNTGYDQEASTCMFDGTGSSSATVKVTINGPEDQKYPVWNGQELAFESLQLVFAVQGSY